MASAGGSNWTGYPTNADYTDFANTARRGFSGQEMLDSVGLIHMNGRVYDMYLGRFLSVDHVIQNLALSQTLNAFSYVMNSPLSYVDPSGWIPLGAAFDASAEQSGGNLYITAAFLLWDILFPIPNVEKQPPPVILPKSFALLALRTPFLSVSAVDTNRSTLP